MSMDAKKKEEGSKILNVFYFYFYFVFIYYNFKIGL